MKNYINVPSDVQYLSDWKDFNRVLPTGKYIFNKVKTGCGASTYFLTNQYPTIVCFPRKLLIRNKMDQIPGMYSVLSPDTEEWANSEEDMAKEFSDKLSELGAYLSSTTVPKILTTYDSFSLVYNYLMSVNSSALRGFLVVVDEWTSMFDDTSFRARQTFEFMTSVLGVDNDVILMSATPPDDAKIEQVPEFRDLPIYELVWSDTVFVKPFINYEEITDVSYSVSKIIQDYREGRTPSKLIGGTVVSSSEAVFFLNNVASIMAIIEKNKILPGEVNILCAKSGQHKKRLRRISRKFKTKYDYGTIPQRGEPHKMFTFCTKTVFLGCDFYSTNAYTYIISNPNKKETALDISSEFYQIIGRQRLAENVFKDEATLLYTSSGIGTEEELNMIINEKTKTTNSYLKVFSNTTDSDARDAMIEVSDESFKLSNYLYSVYVDKNQGVKDLRFNYLVPIQERAVFDNMNRIYNNTFSVARKLAEAGLLDYRDEIISDVFPIFRGTSNFQTLLKFYCEYRDQHPERAAALGEATFIPIVFHKYYNELGSAKLKTLIYLEKNILNEYKISNTSNNITAIIQSKFLVATRYTNKDIKSELQSIYNSQGIVKKAKAGDIENYYTVKRAVINIGGSYKEGFELISKK